MRFTAEIGAKKGSVRERNNGLASRGAPYKAFACWRFVCAYYSTCAEGKDIFNRCSGLAMVGEVEGQCQKLSRDYSTQ